MKPLECLSELGSSPTLGRFLLLECDSLEELICLPQVSPHFALFTAFDLSEAWTVRKVVQHTGA